jgi:hypothetical protein
MSIKGQHGSVHSSSERRSTQSNGSTCSKWWLMVLHAWRSCCDFVCSLQPAVRIDCLRLSEATDVSRNRLYYGCLLRQTGKRRSWLSKASDRIRMIAWSERRRPQRVSTLVWTACIWLSNEMSLYARHSFYRSTALASDMLQNAMSHMSGIQQWVKVKKRTIIWCKSWGFPDKHYRGEYNMFPDLIFDERSISGVAVALRYLQSRYYRLSKSPNRDYRFSLQNVTGTCKTCFQT